MGVSDEATMEQINNIKIAADNAVMAFNNLLEEQQSHLGRSYIDISQVETTKLIMVESSKQAIRAILEADDQKFVTDLWPDEPTAT